MVGPISRGRSKGRVASMSNQTTHFGIMGGTPRLVGHKASILHRLQRNTGAPIPPAPAPGRVHMQTHNQLSVNPQGSGGVGKKTLVTGQR